MQKVEFLQLLDEIVEEPVGTLQGDELLSELDGWDSMAVLGFMSLVDQHFNIVLPTDALVECKSVPDLIGLLGDKITL